MVWLTVAGDLALAAFYLMLGVGSMLWRIQPRWGQWACFWFLTLCGAHHAHHAVHVIADEPITRADQSEIFHVLLADVQATAAAGAVVSLAVSILKMRQLIVEVHDLPEHNETHEP